jgi:hypothetical protein
MQRDDSVMLPNKFLEFFPQHLATYVIAWKKYFAMQKLVCKCKYDFGVRQMIMSGAIRVGIGINNMFMLFQGQFLHIIVKFLFHHLSVMSVRNCSQSCLSNQDCHHRHQVSSLQGVF